MPDRGDHTWCFNNGAHELGKAGKTAARYSMAHLRNVTQATTDYKSTCNVDGSGQTDVVWRNYLGDQTWYGKVDCRRYVVPTTTCDRTWAMINLGKIASDWPNSADRRQQERRHTACHELGHTVTLSHYSGSPPDPMNHRSCMKNESGNLGAA